MKALNSLCLLALIIDDCCLSFNPSYNLQDWPSTTPTHPYLSSPPLTENHRQVFASRRKVVSAYGHRQQFDPALSPFENWAVIGLKAKYEAALSIKCPFFRRRASDLLDGLDMIFRFTIARHKSLPALSTRTAEQDRSVTMKKCTQLTMEEIYAIVLRDWSVSNHKGYYVTGRMTTALYRDDCFFDGPDPDMPVRGLNKYVQAASQLFDNRQTTARLLALDILDDQRLQARWEINGVLRLPWKPVIPPLSGSTIYHVDTDDRLICRHEETWDQGVFQVFAETLFPKWRTMKLFGLGRR